MKMIFISILFFAVVVRLAYGAYQEKLHNIAEEERDAMRKEWFVRNEAEEKALRLYEARTDNFRWYAQWVNGRLL